MGRLGQRRVQGRCDTGRMFVAVAIPIGILAGLLLGGRLDALGQLRLRWARLAVLGLLVQVVLFGLPESDILWSVGPAIYVISTGAVLAAVLANLRVPGLWLVATGAVGNLAAILANGGRMPVHPSTLAAAGIDAPEGFSNSIVTTSPALWPLTDIFALPPTVPLANVFSVGDVLIGAGVVILIMTVMRRAPGASEASLVPRV
jgi:hypothetical protein